MYLVILVLALVIDRLVGDPDWLWRKVPHPVALFGGAVGLADRFGNLNQVDAFTQRRNGLIAVVFLVVSAAGLGVLSSILLRRLGLAGFLLEVAVVAVFLAQKSLADHVGAVARELRDHGLAGGRAAVAHIVGRSPEPLGVRGVCRAAIESLAENFSDGVVAPVFWYALFGLPGLFAYKMVNTADSMIGHKTPRYADFGRAAARLDDLANWPAARLAAVLIAAAALSLHGPSAALNALETTLRDAGLHRSPNAGWPEAAMAGVLGIALSGPRVYGGAAVREPMLNAAGRHDAGVLDIRAGLALFWRSCSVLTLLVALPLAL